MREDAAEDEAHGAAAAATDPNTPNARPRSRGSRNVLTSVPSAAGARIAPNAPCSVRAATSMPNDVAAPPSAEDQGEPDQPGDEHALAAEHVTQPATDQQQAAERQGVRGHDPLPVAVREVQGALG